MLMHSIWRGFLPVMTYACSSIYMVISQVGVEPFHQPRLPVCSEFQPCTVRARLTPLGGPPLVDTGLRPPTQGRGWGKFFDAPAHVPERVRYRALLPCRHARLPDVPLLRLALRVAHAPELGALCRHGLLLCTGARLPCLSLPHRCLPSASHNDRPCWFIRLVARCCPAVVGAPAL
jgi:hypothetical protein